MDASNSSSPRRLKLRSSFVIEFGKYLACSALALLLDSGLYMAALKLGLPLPAAAAIGFLAGLVMIYLLSVAWVFTEHSVSDSWLEFLVFAGIGLFGLLWTELLLWMLVKRLAVEPLTAKFLTAGLVFFINFSARKALLFTRRLAKVAFA